MVKLRVCLFLTALCAWAGSTSQTDFRADIQLLTLQTCPPLTHPHDPYADTALNHRKPVQYKREGAFYRYNPVSLFFTGTMLIYQHLVSPQLSARCIYSRSCSNYAKHAIHELGLVEGIFSSADRLLRCNPGGRAETPDIYLDRNGRLRDEPRRHFHY